MYNLAQREAHERGQKLDLSEEELAFYDALEVNDRAVKILGDEVLRNIALELVDVVRRNVSIDWTQKEAVRAKLRSLVKRTLRKYGLRWARSRLSARLSINCIRIRRAPHPMTHNV